MALTDYVSSDWQKASNAFSPKGSDKQIQVYVEGFEDIAFWHNILSPYEKQARVKFQINSSSGKLNLVKLFANTGNYLIICLDSDYDYLLPEQSKESKQINSNPYVFQTYSYSIENFKCYAESLAGICVQATHNTNELIDFPQLLEQYSKIIYPLFIWNLYFDSIGKVGVFSRDDFSTSIHNEENPDLSQNFCNILEKIKGSVTNKINQLKQQFTEYEEPTERLAEQLNILGLTNENAYLFIQGHELYDFIERFIGAVCKCLRDDRTRELESIEEHRKGTIKEYHNATNRHKNLLSTNNKFKDCFLFKKIENDIEKYLSILTKPIS